MMAYRAMVYFGWCEAGSTSFWLWRIDIELLAAFLKRSPVYWGCTHVYKLGKKAYVTQHTCGTSNSRIESKLTSNKHRRYAVLKNCTKIATLMPCLSRCESL